MMDKTVIGLISDTHGLLRPGAVRALQGVEHILHAGDVGAPEILDELRNIAPVSAVRGNVDNKETFPDLPETQYLETGGISFYVIHNLDDLDIQPGAAGIQIVVYGHTHVDAVTRKNGVLYINPGSAGPHRFRLKASLALVEIEAGQFNVKTIKLSL